MLIEIEQTEEDIIEISCSENEYELIWKEYFDLNYDYKIVDSLPPAPMNS